MKTVSRAVIAATAGALLVGLSACSGNGSGGAQTQAPPQGKAIQGFNPCTFFQPGELTSWGLSTQSQDFTQVSFQPGCQWEGSKMTIGLQKNADDSVQSFGKSGNFDKYEPTKVAGRDAAEVIVGGGTGTGGCNYVVSAGGGLAVYQLTAAMRDTIPDPCGELRKIVDQTASRLPK